MAVEVDRSPRQRGVSLVERNKQAALERQANIEKAEAEAAAQAEAERKNDGRQYDMEVEGFNIGDSLVRRAVAANKKVAKLQEEMFEEDINTTDDEIESDIPEVGYYKKDIKEELYDEDIDDFVIDTTPYEHEQVFVDEEEPTEELEEEDISEEISEESIEEETEVEEKEEFSPVIDTEKVVSLPANQSEIKIDEKDFNDIDIAAEIEADVEGEDTVQIENEKVSKEEMERLKTVIKKKVVKLPDISNMPVSKKPVSVNQVVSTQSISRVVDWPLMEAGKLISMRSFAGPEMDDLTRDLEKETVRNRANIRRENLRLMYDHLTSAKSASFDTWLRTELVDDYASYEMAAMVASYNGANYTPMNCTDPKCNNIWLTDNIPMKKHMKFNSKEAENRFNQILTAPDTVKSSPRLKRVPISESIAVDIRVKLSFYTAFFENSILDPKFSSKYSKLLDLIMYIDEMYEIKPDGLHKVIYKVDPNSEVKTLKYRIASYAKIITNLSSDAYTRLYVEIRDALEDTSTDYITYVMPEVTCPKCGRVIEATEVGSRPYSLVLARHRLTQLTAKL